MGKIENRFEAISAALKHVYEATDTVIIIIRGHILVDNFLMVVLDKYLIGGIKRFVDTTHSEKLVLASATGILSSDELLMFSQFNRIRNSVAHNVDARITPAQEAEVRALFRDLGFSHSVGEGAALYQTYVTLLYSILATRLVDIGERKAEFLGPPMDDAYWKRVSGTAIAPLVMAYTGEIANAIATGVAKLLKSWSDSMFNSLAQARRQALAAADVTDSAAQADE